MIYLPFAKYSILVQILHVDSKAVWLVSNSVQVYNRFENDLVEKSFYFFVSLGNFIYKRAGSISFLDQFLLITKKQDSDMCRYNNAR